jgi:O-methyltransferase
MIRGIFNTITDPRIRRNWRYIALLRLGRWLMPTYRFQSHQLAWWQDEAFNHYQRKFGLRGGADSDCRWTLNELTRLVLSVPGDTAECGVLEGASSYLICRSLSRKHFLFDSFEGLSEPATGDGDFYGNNDMACDLEVAQTNLAEFTNISFHKGWIPERFVDVADRNFCFVHIDVNLYQPTRDSIEFFYPRMNRGGVMVFDDYGFAICPGAKRAVDDFLSDKPEQIVSLTCGSAFLVRR